MVRVDAVEARVLDGQLEGVGAELLMARGCHVDVHAVGKGAIGASQVELHSCGSSASHCASRAGSISSTDRSMRYWTGWRTRTSVPAHLRQKANASDFSSSMCFRTAAARSGPNCRQPCFPR